MPRLPEPLAWLWSRLAIATLMGAMVVWREGE
jgi:hypothetical protein